MYFKDRHEAGKQLAKALKNYANLPDTIVIGLPRGGVVNAYEVALALNLPLDITCPRKIGAPFSEEYAIGAITETGESILNHEMIKRYAISPEYLKTTMEEEKKVAQHRLHSYRKNRPPRNVSKKNVIIVDDGLATGNTMKAAIQSIKQEGAAKIVVAVPVSPPDTLQEIKNMVDEVVCLYAPLFFQAVGQFYEEFYSTEDEEVIGLLQRQTSTRNDPSR